MITKLILFPLFVIYIQAQDAANLSPDLEHARISEPKSNDHESGPEYHDINSAEAKEPVYQHNEYHPPLKSNEENLPFINEHQGEVTDHIKSSNIEPKQYTQSEYVETFLNKDDNTNDITNEHVENQIVPEINNVDNEKVEYVPFQDQEFEDYSVDDENNNEILTEKLHPHDTYEIIDTFNKDLVEVYTGHNMDTKNSQAAPKNDNPVQIDFLETASEEVQTPPTHTEEEVDPESSSQPVRLKIMSGSKELGDLYMNEEELMDDDVSDDDTSDVTDHASNTDPGAEEEEDPPSEQKKLAKELYDKARAILRKRTTGVGTSAPAYSSAYELIAQAAKLNYTAALEDVAYAYLFGRHFRQNLTKAMVMFEELASRGSPSAQMGLGFIHAVGLGVPSSQAKAFIYYNFAALGGNSFAQMALGYRHKYGYSVEQSCESSLTYYRRVARIVAQEVKGSRSSENPGVIQRIRLLDLAEPPQTPAPVAGSDAAPDSSTGSALLDKDLLKYYKFLADKGDVQAQVGLGQLLYQGGRGVAPDPAEAARLFAAAAHNSENAYAQAYLGKMYLEGNEALPQDNNTAFDYFRKSADQNNPMGQTGLGLIYLYGHGVPADPQKAFAYFKLAADQGGPEAQLNIANMYFTGTGVSSNYKNALKYYTGASQSGNLLAFFNLGQMHAVGLGAMRSCYTAMELFKNVAERGFWGRMLMEAYEAYKAEDITSALVLYMFLAEIGYETAQSNAAYILEKETINWFPYNESLSRAFLLWKRAAIQGYPMARIKLGDFHYYGYGTPIDFESAAQNYRLAYEGQNSARAVFNLAFMHEKGFGLKKDLHLARRYYDMAMEASPDAFVPVTLALAKLSFLLYFEQLQKLNLKDVLNAVYDVDHYLPQDWDLYIILGFAFLLGTMIYLRRNQRP